MSSVQEQEELVYVVDLTTYELDRTADEVEGGGGGENPDSGAPLPQEPPTPIHQLAILIDGWEQPLVLPIEPTRDVVYLDALARLLRIAVLAGERVPAVAINYGEVYERSLAFERRLPEWVYSGIEAKVAAKLPTEVRLVLCPKKRRAPSI